MYFFLSTKCVTYVSKNRCEYNENDWSDLVGRDVLRTAKLAEKADAEATNKHATANLMFNVSMAALSAAVVMIAVQNVDLMTCLRQYSIIHRVESTRFAWFESSVRRREVRIRGNPVFFFDHKVKPFGPPLLVGVCCKLSSSPQLLTTM